MEYCFLRGFLVVFLIQHLTFEGLATTIQSSTAVTLQTDPVLPQEPDLPPPPPAEVVPVVAPPSLKEVQQAVQEASEQAEGRGAEEVLKELLERVVEAALGQVEGGGGGGEVKADEAAVQEVIEEEEEEEDDAPGAEEGGDESEAEVMEQTPEGEDKATVGGDNDIVEEQEVVDVSENVGIVDVGEEEEEETLEEEEEETTVETGKDESLDPEISQGIVVETEAETLEEVEEDKEEQVVLTQENVENETQEVKETLDEEVIEPEQQTVMESVSRLVENQEQIWVDEGTEGGVIVQRLDNENIESTQTVVGEPVEQEEEEEEEEVNKVKDDGEAEDEQGRLLGEGEAAEEAEGAEVGGADGGQSHGAGVIKGEPGGGEEEQIALETSHGGDEEDQEVPLISEAPVEEQSPEVRVPTPSSAPGGAEPGENAPGDDKSTDNEIIGPTGDLLARDPALARPTMDNVEAEEPESEGEEPGEANELVEETAGDKETSDLGLEAWKIGAISAAAFLVLETVIIIIYILKCRNKNSSAALQRACEEGGVEPEAATGGDCSDDTLPAGNGDAQQIAALGPCDAASTPIQSNIEQNHEDQAIAMSELPPNSAEESANAGPGPGPGPGPGDSSQDLRTSTL